jgi:Protein of unknown function (DUF3303)
MVVERFKTAGTELVRERFSSEGRMLPEGVTYHQSWMASTGDRCFQLMEASSYDLLLPWIARWDDLVDFEVVPVMSSAEFWSAFDSPAPISPR